MFKLLYSFVCIIPCFVFFQQNINYSCAKDIEGVWITEKKDSKIQIYEQNGSYYGKIVWALPEYEKYVGNVVMKAVKYNPSQNDYICPWIYSPRLDVTAHAVIKVNGDTLNVKAIKGIISSHQIFIRDKK